MSTTSVQSTVGVKRQRPSSPRCHSPPKRHKSISPGPTDPTVSTHRHEAGLMGKLSDRTIPVLNLLADSTLDFLAQLSFDQLQSLSEREDGNLFQGWNHWRSMIVDGLTCNNVSEGEANSLAQSLARAHNDEHIHKTAVAFVASIIASYDLAMIEALRDQVLAILAVKTHSVRDWQIDILHAYFAVANDASVKFEAPCPLFMDETFLPSLADKLQSSHVDPESTKAAAGTQLLERCAQTRAEWLQLELQGRLTGIEARNKTRLLSLLHTFLPAHIIPFACPERSTEDRTQRTAREMPRDYMHTDDAFSEFERRKEAAMKFALQASENGETSRPQENTDLALLRQNLHGSEHSGAQDQRNKNSGQSRDLPLHTPTLKAPLGALRDTSTSTAKPSLRAAYDDARLAAHNRAVERKRPPSPLNASSNRKVWSADEENALMEGLDHVRGPHWRDILALYGDGGSISEVLKNRSQVQLKDKARNMKLFFVKNGLEVPPILKAVTGELRKVKVVEQEQSEEASAVGQKDPPNTSGSFALLQEAVAGEKPSDVFDKSLASAHLDEEDENIHESVRNLSRLQGLDEAAVGA